MLATKKVKHSVSHSFQPLIPPMNNLQINILRGKWKGPCRLGCVESDPARANSFSVHIDRGVNANRAVLRKITQLISGWRGCRTSRRNGKACWGGVRVRKAGILQMKAWNKSHFDVWRETSVVSSTVCLWSPQSSPAAAFSEENTVTLNCKRKNDCTIKIESKYSP